MTRNEMNRGSIFGMIGAFLLTSTFYVAKVFPFDPRLILLYVIASAALFSLSVKSTKKRNALHAMDKEVGKYRYPMPPAWYGLYYLFILVFTGLPLALEFLVKDRSAFPVLFYGGWATWALLNVFSTRLLLKEVALLNE